MKRFFRNLKTLAMVAVVGVASLAVSCSEPYDDTQIKADIEDLKTRVEALEIKLTNEVNTLKALIDAEVAELNEAIEAVEDKIAILDYTQNEDGSWTLTTKTGEEVTIYPQYQENNEGLLTVIEENGTYYWAQIVDGKAVALVDKDGNKYAAHHATVVPEINIPECHDEPQVRQDENGHNEVSFDGGQNWYKMGGGDLGLFQSVVVSEDGLSLTFVLNNGVTFTTTLPEEFKFSIKSGKLFLKAEEAKTVEMELQAIQECEVIAKPEGWKTAIDGKKLTITAPAEGVGEIEGVVKVLAITNENRAAFAKLHVSAGKGYFVEVKEVETVVGYDEEGNEVKEGVLSVVVTNQMVTEVDDYGQIYQVIPSLYVGFMPAAEFSPEGVVEDLSNWGYVYAYQITQQVVLQEGETESVQTFPVSDLYSDGWSSIDIVAGVEYVAWVSNFEAGATWWDPNVLYPENFVYTSYVNRCAEVKEVSATAFDITIDVTVGGYDKYIVYLNELKYATGWEEELFAYWQKYGYEFGFERTDSTFNGSLFDFGYDANGWSEKIQGLPGNDYLLLVLPLEEGKEAADYTVDDVIDLTFTTADLQAGGGLDVAISAAEIGYTNIKAKFEAEGAHLIYYQYYRAAAWMDEMESWTDEAWVAALTTGGYPKFESSFNFNLSGVNMAEDIRFAAIAVDENGKYGNVSVEKFTSKNLEFSDALAVTATYEFSNENKDIAVTFETTGSEAVKYRYYFINNESTWNYTFGGSYEEAGKYLATTTQTYYYKETTETTVSNTNMSWGSKYWFVVIAYDADGNVSNPYGFEFTTSMPGEILCKDETGWETGKPTIELVSYALDYEASNPRWSDHTVKVKVTPGEGAVDTYFMRMDESYEGTYSTEWSLLQYCVSHYKSTYDVSYVAYGYTQKVTESTEYTVVDEGAISNTLYFYMTWSTVGDDGLTYWHECEKINVREFCGLEAL